MIRALAVLCIVIAAPLAAQERDTESFRLGRDLFIAGGDAVVDAEGVDDAYAAGERVEILAPVAGSALLAGRRVASTAEVAGDLWAAGADVSLAAPVGGDATLAGYDVSVGAPVRADLRAAARHLRIEAPVAGTALIAAATVELDATIAGDAVVAAEALDFGPEARIGGRLVLYDDAETPLVVPERVIPAERVERRLAAHDPAWRERRERDWLELGLGFLFGTVVLAAITAVVAALAPQGLEGLRAVTRARPWRTFGIGFLTLATLIGAAVLITLTIIGILAAPFLILAAVLLAMLGYLIGVYLVGLAIWERLGQLPPDGFGERLLAALIGAAVVGAVALVPFLGWLILLILALTGLGALTTAWLRPEFRA